MKRVVYVDAAAGIAGDMLLGALVDAGLPAAHLEEVVEGLGLEGVAIRTRAVMRGALRALKVDVLVDGRPADDGGVALPSARHHAQRTLAGVRTVLEGAQGLDARGLEDAKRVFEALAEAEGRVHGRPAEEVHFHEVGALDALVDIVGTCTGLRRLGVDEVRVGPLPFGTGTVKTAHGELPLPAPAVLHLLAGLPTVPSLETHEQVTPTGAALVAVLATGSTPPAGFTVRRTGTGAGTFEGGRLPNVVRLVVGEVPEEGPEETTPADAVLLETNLDDATGQVIARALECALAAGALDAWATPIQMKKGRPGVLVSVLGRPEERERLEALLFRELPTTGIRRRATRRTVLVRRPVSVETPWGPVGVKVRETPDGPEGTPEYEDCARRASEHDVAVRRVIEAARAAFAARS